MSDVPPPDPQWWQAADGKWYPPPPQRPSASKRTAAKLPSADPAKKRSGCSTMIWLLVLLIAGGAIAGAFANRDGDRGSDADGSATLACRHFRNVASDYSDGILTLGELRDKLQEVEGDARYSEEPGVASAARELLAAATALDVDAMIPAIGRLDQACTQAGV